ncbi:hypothetical protein [Azospirillum picis]|uniref:Uncharacterized protein n=1 Tax=Azospirillum picis TaxID=488438 RepID=A0ABU0MGI7_9PROT|nr:hypothetical protein [Azospirillum picis]MBP2298463.1 hypothetical protein [Azospirillum picis]MDQ0532488.1 hypothetical protein [Azospirillum picis]
MPHDFGSSRDRRSASGSGPGIGFHELRQACEISALREDLERLAQEAGVLREGVERAVEEVRDRFAALSPDDMTDPVALASVLQSAVATLLEIREQARRLDTRTGPLSDDERPSWLGAADSPRLRRPSPAEPMIPPPEAPPPAPAALKPEDPTTAIRVVQPPLTAARELSPPPERPRAPTKLSPLPSPLPSASPLPVAGGQAAWLSGAPAPSRTPADRADGEGIPRSAGGVDWLGPAGR